MLHFFFICSQSFVAAISDVKKETAGSKMTTDFLLSVEWLLQGNMHASQTCRRSMVESQRISDCRAPATVIDSQTTPHPHPPPAPPPLGENLLQRVKTTSSLDRCQTIIHRSSYLGQRRIIWITHSYTHTDDVSGADWAVFWKRSRWLRWLSTLNSEANQCLLCGNPFGVRRVRWDRWLTQASCPPLSDVLHVMH